MSDLSRLQCIGPTLFGFRNVFVWLAAEAPSWLLKDLASLQSVYNKTSNMTERCITSLRMSMIASQTNRTEGRCVSVR